MNNIISFRLIKSGHQPGSSPLLCHVFRWTSPIGLNTLNILAHTRIYSLDQTSILQLFLPKMSQISYNFFLHLIAKCDIKIAVWYKKFWKLNGSRVIFGHVSQSCFDRACDRLADCRFVLRTAVISQKWIWNWFLRIRFGQWSDLGSIESSINRTRLIKITKQRIEKTDRNTSVFWRATTYCQNRER